MSITNIQPTVEQRALLSRTIVDALSGLSWLSNLQRLEIVDALSPIFVAQPFNSDALNAKREGLKKATEALRAVDDQYHATGLDELSRERMALTRAVSQINDLIQQTDKAKRPAGQLGWRRDETLRVE